MTVWQPLRTLVDEGRLRLFFQLSRPRSSSNAVTRLAATGVDLSLRSFAMELSYDAKDFFELVHEEVDGLLRASRSSHVSVYIKEHAACLSLDQLLAPIVDTYVMVVRDPLLTYASLLRLQALPQRSEAGVRDCGLVRGVCRSLLHDPRGALARRFPLPAEVRDACSDPTFTRDFPASLLAFAREILDHFAREAGFTDWSRLQHEVARSEDFTPLEALLEQLYPIVPYRDCASPREALVYDPYGFLAACWEAMDGVLERSPQRAVVIDATVLQARGRGDVEISRFADRLGLSTLRRADWGDQTGDRTMGLRSVAGAPWYEDALKSREFRLPTRPTLPLERLPASVRRRCEDDLGRYLGFLRSPQFSGPSTPAELDALLDVVADERGRTVRDLNPVVSYALAATVDARADERDTARGQLRRVHAGFESAFDRLDRAP